jgi:adenosylcobinamide-phosphate synthase
VANYAFHLSLPLILAVVAIDLVAGDPTWLPHPVRLIGATISYGESRLLNGKSAADLRNGAILAAGIVMISAAAVWVLIESARRLWPPAAPIVAVALGWTALALKGLDRAAAAVERALLTGEEGEARRLLPALVGRDPEALDHAGIIRATVESVAENCNDAVIAPLFFLFLGGPVAAIAYKTINTLDSMIGYRDQRYLYFGRAAARLDDFAGFIPARLTAGCIMFAAALTSGRLSQAFASCRLDARRHPSPNAGYPEAAMAGALGIELGGDAVYGGEVELRPVFGKAEREPAIADITAVRRIMRIAAAIALLILAAVRAAIPPFGR